MQNDVTVLYDKFRVKATYDGRGYTLRLLSQTVRLSTPWKDYSVTASPPTNMRANTYNIVVRRMCDLIVDVTLYDMRFVTTCELLEAIPDALNAIEAHHAHLNCTRC